jgi:hypothetical protein
MIGGGSLAALLVAVPAWAALPVAYDADYKTLKKNVSIGDSLSFELFETTFALRRARSQ